MSVHFRVDVGEFMLIGPREPAASFEEGGLRELRPTFHDDHTCVSGQTCVVDGMLGRFMTELDSIMILETCGAPSIVPRFPLSGVIDRVTKPAGCTLSCEGGFNPGTNNSDCDRDGAVDKLDECPFNFSKVVAGVCGCEESEDDFDGDGTPNCIDQCPYDSSKTRAGVCGALDVDSDADGVLDCNDKCPGIDDYAFPLDYYTPVTSKCCSGDACSDDDADGRINALDSCPKDPNKFDPGICGCDNDGTPDCIDQCPYDRYKVRAGKCGCGTSDVDSDGDQMPDCHDTCPFVNDWLLTQLSLSFADVVVTAAGGQYRLCWCAGGQDCALPAQHKVDFGRLTLIGPALDHQYTCVSGQSCRLDGLQGQYLNSENGVIMVLDTCGSSYTQGSFLYRVPDGG
jgi:hypothetical protein